MCAAHSFMATSGCGHPGKRDCIGVAADEFGALVLSDVTGASRVSDRSPKGRDAPTGAGSMRSTKSAAAVRRRRPNFVSHKHNPHHSASIETLLSNGLGPCARPTACEIGKGAGIGELDRLAQRATLRAQWLTTTRLAVPGAGKADWGCSTWDNASRRDAVRLSDRDDIVRAIILSLNLSPMSALRRGRGRGARAGGHGAPARPRRQPTMALRRDLLR